MTTSSNYSLKVLTTGFMVLVFFAVPMFWGRYFCAFALRVGLPREAQRVEISPSGLLPEAVENDPNAHRKSEASARLDDDILVASLGLFDYVLSKSPGGRRSDVLYYEEDKAWMYFDRPTGQLVFCDTYSEQRNGGSVTRVTAPHYAGPEGMSKSPGDDLGRFVDPVVAPLGRQRIIYDRKLRRFFALDREVMTVRTGPELDTAVPYEPVRIGSSWTREGVHLDFEPTMRRVPRKEDLRREYDWQFNIYWSLWDGEQYISVIDASGRIDRLDRQTLELVAGKAHLPAPKTLYGQGVGRPRQLLDYQVTPVRLSTARTPRGIEWEHAGMVAASASRQGTSIALAVFDQNGKLIRSVDSRAIPYGQKAEAIRVALDELSREGKIGTLHLPSPSRRSALAVLTAVPWGPSLTTFQFVLENLHPPVLTMASFCLTNSIEAGASHRTLFLMPNSFVALHRDMVGDDVFTEFFKALATMMLPAVLLVVFLAWRVLRDAKIVGLSSNARLLWMLGTLGFGLPAYITYRLTRPKAALVTCANCGLPRRPDMDRCHRCNGPWCVPELNPPAWRVLDGGRKDLDEPPATLEESQAE